MSSTENHRRRPPDGGWGWFVCLGSGLITLSLRSLDPSFGLLFNDLLNDLGIDSIGTSLIMSVLDSIVNFTGLLVGPLLKKYSFRTVSLLGSLLSCTGLILTSRANSMLHIICTYSILGGLGTGLAIAASFVALNTYFEKKRGQAVGFSMAGTALGMMLVPQMIHVLLVSYGFRGTMLIAGGCALHSVVGSLLLLPLEMDNNQSKRKNEKLLSANGDGQSIRTKDERETAKNCTEMSLLDIKRNRVKVDQEDANNKASCLQKIKETFDLDLLKDTVYLNVVVGLSLYYVAESNFKLVTPFFLKDIGLTNAEVASCLSITAFADIVARLILPTIYDRCGYKKRTVFWVTCLLIGAVRSFLAEQSKGLMLTLSFVVAGFSRGATLVNLNLCVSECCSLKKLPSAFGIFMVAKGIFVVAISPLLGFIRDASGSYSFCIHIMTVIIITVFVAWSIEFLCNSRRNGSKVALNNVDNV